MKSLEIHTYHTHSGWASVGNSLLVAHLSRTYSSWSNYTVSKKLSKPNSCGNSCSKVCCWNWCNSMERGCGGKSEKLWKCERNYLLTWWFASKHGSFAKLPSSKTTCGKESKAGERINAACCSHGLFKPWFRCARLNRKERLEIKWASTYIQLSLLDHDMATHSQNRLVMKEKGQPQHSLHSGPWPEAHLWLVAPCRGRGGLQKVDETWWK